MLTDVLARIAVKPPRKDFPADLRGHFAAHGVPKDIIDDLAQSTYDGWLPVGPLYLIPMADFLHETFGISACLEHGLLPVAGCLNYDVVVVECASRRVGYVSHDLLWGKWDDIQQCLCPSRYLWEEFWEAAVAQHDFPIDSWEAKNRWGDGGELE